MSPRESEIKRNIAYFKNPKLYQPADIIDNPDLVPKLRGVYGWYFNVLPPTVPQNDYVNINGWKLLYIGISGRRTLRKRLLNEHLKGKANTSTLCLSLGVLLLDRLKLKPQIKGGNKSKIWFGDIGERSLQKWMLKHAQIAWLVSSIPKMIESEAIELYGRILPLNIRENKVNPYSEILKKHRKKCRKMASPMN